MTTTPSRKKPTRENALDYLVELGELSSNPFSNFKIKASLFTPIVAKESEYEVFNEVEEQQIKALALEDFEMHPHSTSAIALIANFSLGLRVGELVALKWKDLKSPYLQIRRMEQKQYDKYCKALGIIKKTNHKARKTCLTKIADNANINLKDAMEFGGHKDVQTYIKHYCFSRYSDEQKREELEKTLKLQSHFTCKKV